MQYSMVFARFRDNSGGEIVPTLTSKVLPVFEQSEGVVKQLLVREVEDHAAIVHILIYESQALAEKGFQKVGEVLDPMMSEIDFALEAPDVRWVIPQLHKTYDSDKMFEGRVVTLSSQNVGIGFGDEVCSRLVNAFDEVHSLKGLAGYVIGHGAQLHDEITAIAIWDSIESAQASIPANVDYDIRIYESI